MQLIHRWMKPTHLYKFQILAVGLQMPGTENDSRIQEQLEQIASEPRLVSIVVALWVISVCATNRPHRWSILLLLLLLSGFYRLHLFTSGNTHVTYLFQCKYKKKAKRLHWNDIRTSARKNASSVKGDLTWNSTKLLQRKIWWIESGLKMLSTYNNISILEAQSGKKALNKATYSYWLLFHVVFTFLNRPKIWIIILTCVIILFLKL